MTKTITFNVVKIDETGDWVEEIQQYGPIWSVYFYDPNEATYLCEVTPSHYLYAIGYYAERETPEEIQDAIDETWQLWNDRGIYVHCRDVQRLPILQTDTFTIEDDDDYSVAVEQAEEYYAGNSPY